MKVLGLIGISVLVVVANGASRVAETATRCSKVSFPAVRTANSAFFIARAEADTVLAGPGVVEYGVAPGHVGPAVTRPIYGQRVRFERIDLHSSLDGSTEVHGVVVPWDYGPDCVPTPWASSARFVEAGRRGFYDVTLRDSSEWASGLPTFDLTRPLSIPYPNDRDHYARRSDSAASLDDVFAAHALLPVYDDLGTRAWQAVGPFMDWIRADVARQRAYPLSGMARGLSRQVEHERMRNLDPTIAGTYRLVVASDAARDTFFIRTADRPAMSWAWYSIRREVEAVPPWEYRAAGYEILFWHAQTERALPTDSASATSEARGAWTLRVGDPAARVGDAAVRRGHLELPQLKQSLPDNAAISAAVDTWSRLFSDRWNAGTLQLDELEFRERDGGQVTFRGEYALEGDQAVVVIGERISLMTLPRLW